MLSYLILKLRGVAAIEVDERRVRLLVLCIGWSGCRRAAVWSIQRLLMVALGRVGRVLIGIAIHRGRRGRRSVLIEPRVE